MGSLKILGADPSKISPLEERIRTILISHGEAVSYKMLENVGINRKEASVAIGQLRSKGLAIKVKGGFKAV